MELLNKTDDKIEFVSDIAIELANAIRKSVNEIPVLAIDECDIYKNDSALYDEMLAHRIGVVPLKNQKLKDGQTVEFSVKKKGKGERTEVVSGDLGDGVVYSEMPLVLLEDGQEVEIVARAKQGKGKEHAKFSPGLFYYKQLANIKISKDGEKHEELAERFPNVFEFDGKLKVKNAGACDFDSEDLEEYSGVEVEFTDKLVIDIESWGQIKPEEIFVGASKALKDNLSEVLKAVK